MTVIDKRQVIKNYVEHANERVLDALNVVIELYESKFEDDFTSEPVRVDDLSPQLREKYDRAIKDSKAGRKISNEEMTLKIEKLLNQ